MAVFRKWKSWEHMLTSWLRSTWAHTLFQLQQTHFWWIRRRSDWRGSSIDFVCRRQSKNWFGAYWRKILERCVFFLRRLQSLVRTRIHTVFHKQSEDIFFGGDVGTFRLVLPTSECRCRGWRPGIQPCWWAEWRMHYRCPRRDRSTNVCVFWHYW